MLIYKIMNVNKIILLVGEGNGVFSQKVIKLVIVLVKLLVMIGNIFLNI